MSAKGARVLRAVALLGLDEQPSKTCVEVSQTRHVMPADSLRTPSEPPLAPCGPPVDPLWTPSGPPLAPLWAPKQERHLVFP